MQNDATTRAVAGAGQSQADAQDQHTPPSDDHQPSDDDQQQRQQDDQQQDDPQDADEPDDEQDADTISAEKARKLRSENRSLRTRLRNAERERDELRQQLGNAPQRIHALERQLREHTARGVVIEAAEHAGAISGKAVWAMLRDDLTYDDTGVPTNVEDAIDRLRKSDPDLFTSATLDGGVAGGAVTAAPGDDPIAAAYATNAASRRTR